MFSSAAISLLVPYVKHLGEELVKETGKKIGMEAGEVVWHKAKELYEIVKAKFVSTPESAEVLVALEDNPDDVVIQSDVRRLLEQMMISDKDFAMRIAGILEEVSKAGAGSVFQTKISGDVQKQVQIGNVSGDVKF
jgi:uncharacterized protein YidB (DUF937 family)